LSSFVLDASMALGWILDKPIPPRASQVRQRLRQTVALVPSLWHYEVTNVLVMARRTRHITEAPFTKQPTSKLPYDTAFPWQRWTKSLK